MVFFPSAPKGRYPHCPYLARPACALLIWLFLIGYLGFFIATPASAEGIRGKINMGGPEAWPEERSLSTQNPVGSASGSIMPGQVTGTIVSPDAHSTGGVSGQVTNPVSGSNSGGGFSAPVQSSPVTPGEPQSAMPDDIPRNTVPLVRESPNEAPKQVTPGTVPQSSPTKEQTPAQSSTSTVQPAPVLPNSGASASGAVSTQVQGLPGAQEGEKKEEKKEETEEQPREVLYVDEQGNPVEKPAEPEKMLQEAQRLLEEKQFESAISSFEEIRALPNLDPELLEIVLYRISDCVWERYADDALAGYEAIISTTNEALNFNLRSKRVPDALIRLGLANLKVDNLVDAQGYMEALGRRYPDYPGVAQGYTALGEAFLKQGKNAEAEKYFSYVLDKYSESSHLLATSVGLAKALHNQKKYERAHVILDFISKRWPRHYVEDPSYLLLQADNEIALNATDKVLQTFWLFFNLDPQREGNEHILLQMGDIYLKQSMGKSADFMFREILRRYPESAEAVTAKLRLAEKGIYESPLDYDTMTKVFARGAKPSLWQVYTEVAETSDTNSEAVLCRLKKVMWQYWNKQYTDAMGLGAEFIDAYPEHPDREKVRDIIWLSFKHELDNSLTEQNFGRILILWNGFPLVRERYGAIDPRLRYALAQGCLERGNDRQALTLLGDFLRSPMDPNFGELAFTEFFNRYLAAGDWNNILDLGNIVASWPMQPQLRRQLDYAMALSAQNLNLGAPALAMWRGLAKRDDIPLYQRAYATYFLARDAEQRKDIKDSYDLNKEVIALFTQLHEERSDKADPMRIKEAMNSLMDICEVGNRIPEALQWVGRYRDFVPEGSDEYPALRFRESRLYRKLGDTNRSRALLEEIVRRAPDTPYGKAAAAELHTFDVSRDLQNFMSGGSGSQQQPEAQQGQQ